MDNPRPKPLLLLIDDVPEMAGIVRWLSKRAGVELVHCSSVEESWTALHKRTPELVLLDFNLIGYTGADLCRRLRAAPEFAGLRVALFVDRGQEEDICYGLEAGADLVFDKNLVGRPEEWQRRLAEILTWTRGRVWTKLVALKTDRPWSSPPRNWPGVFNRALQLALVRQMSTSLLRLVLHRAIRYTFAHEKRRDDPHVWLQSGDLALKEEKLAPATKPETVAYLGASLAEQLWCLLGSRDSAFFTAALTPVVPDLTEALLQ